MDVSLISELEKLVESRLQCGSYCAANEVLREGQRLPSFEDRRPQVPIENATPEPSTGT